MKAEQLRKSILQMAIQGKLVPQNPADEPASVLLEKIRVEKQKLIKAGKIKKDKNDSVIFKGEDNCYYEKVGNETKCIDAEIDFDLPDNWCFSRIGTLIFVQTGASFKKEEVLDDKTQMRVLRGGNIRNGAYCFFDNDIFIKKALVSENIILQQNDLITPSVTSIENIGKLARITQNYSDVTAGGFVFIFRCHYKSETFAKYLQYSLQSTYFVSLMKSITKKSGQAFYNLGKERFVQLIMPIPPIEEQSRIVTEIEKYEPLLAQYDKLEKEATLLDDTIKDKLKKSILQYAIQGKLVPQDENNEHASVLLERIRAEKKVQLGKKYVDSYIYKGDDNCYYEHIDKKDTNITSDIPFELPKKWRWERWGNISESIQYGFNAPAQIKGRIRMLRISDIQNNIVNWNTVPYCEIKEEEIETYKLKQDDILFARTGGTVGKSYIVSEIPVESIYAGYLIRTRYSKNFCPQYLKYFMESQLYWEQLRNGTIATAQPNCNGQTLSKMFLPIPPLTEQQRIVAKIDELFTFVFESK